MDVAAAPLTLTAMEPAFGVLGPLLVRDPAGDPVPMGGQKPRELLAALVLHRGQILPVDRLVDHLWGEAASAGAATTLRTYVGQVRRILDRAAVPATLESRGGGYCFDTDPTAVDAELFERQVREGQRVTATDGPAAADEVLGRALDLWRGDVLVDLGPPEFAAQAVLHLGELRLVAWETWLDAQLALGRHRAVVTRLQALVDEHPFRERFSAQLMLALYRSGRQADALAVSAATRLRLAEELGLDPSPELRDLETSMLQQDPDLDAVGAAEATQRWSTVSTAVSAAAAGPAAPGLEAHAARSLAQGHMELLEREHERARLSEAIAAAARGEGSGLAVAGDAGTGKSTLVQVACADGPRIRLLRSGCEALSTPRSLGPLRDIATEAGFTTVLGEDDVVLTQVCEDVLRALTEEPTVLVVEDLHWVDAATADVLRFVARRIGTAPLALLVTYREHEIGPRHPARQLLGDMANHERLSTLTLAPLSEDGVRRLVEGSGLDPHQVHRLAGGNPFFVTEIVKDPDRPLPRTVRDAVLARTADVTDADLEVLQLVATAPDRLDDRVLPVLDLDLSAFGRLEDTGLLTHARGGLAFRHELARQAIESTIPIGAAPRLHLRVVDALERAGVVEPAVLTHHAVAARDAERAHRYAIAAADESVRSGAHHEAAAFLQVAIDHLRSTDPAERAALLQRLSFEQYTVNTLPDAIASARATVPLWRAAGDEAGVAAAHERIAVMEYFSAHGDEAEDLADRAARIAADSGAKLAHGSALATRAFLAYHRSDLELAMACTQQAGALADEVDEEFLRSRAQLIQHFAALATDDPAAREPLAEHIEHVRLQGWDDMASTGYSQLVTLDLEHRRLSEADRVLATSLPFADERGIEICSYWQTSVRARLRHARGEWDDALADVEKVLEGTSMPVAHLWPSLVAALVSLRRTGEPDRSALGRAWELMRTIDEPLRRLPVFSALAEVMWLTGVPDDRVTGQAPQELAAVRTVRGAHWVVGELGAWLDRLGIPVERGSVPAPFALAAEGRTDEAAAWWAGNGEPYAEALVLADSGEERHRARAVRLMEDLGARAAAARVRDGMPVTPADRR
ncbi:LuxR family transcriptional regulator [Nocardioides silvaticus]|uniref:LuxR family transcriptional regulator n=2 Tax=Nocardioides silvaticus TaxID=2201891 RepID=A0A316TDQ0_9ACTN|nr:LuxR family transcriptional regulator [Nocardioides silvaticus]